MTASILEVAGQIAMVAGAAFCLIGALGLQRMPDFYSRTHPASMIDTLGATLLLAGLALYAVAGHGDAATLVRIVMIAGFLYVTSPTAAHALAKAAFARGLRARPEGASPAPADPAAET